MAKIIKYNYFFNFSYTACNALKRVEGFFLNGKNINFNLYIICQIPIL